MQGVLFGGSKEQGMGSLEDYFSASTGSFKNYRYININCIYMHMYMYIYLIITIYFVVVDSRLRVKHTQREQ